MENKYNSIQNTPFNVDFEHDWRLKSFSRPFATVRLGTLFSGIGAIEQALKKLNLNMQIMFAGDIDDNCRKSYFANYDLPESNWHSDICKFDASSFLGKIDLLVGGAPCQAFSLRGKHGGFEDTRGTLFREFARVVMECRPKVFIFENVKGMLSHDKGHTWNVIKTTFESDCGYQIFYQVLNGKNYGIPQSRDRLFCVGFREETNFKYPAPIPLKNTVFDFLQKEFNKKYFLKAKGVNFITRKINFDKSYTQINGRILLCQKRNQQFNWHGDFIFYPQKLSDKNTPLTDELLFDVRNCEEEYYVDRTSYALNSIDSNNFITEVVKPSDVDYHFGRFRKLTPRECLRMMGFCDSFKIVVSDTEIYKQAGNSIIVDVLVALLKQMDITRYAEQ